MSTSQPLLRAEGLCVRFGGLQAVDDVAVSVEEGSIVALIGPNGAGKTTLFHLLTGFIKPDSGTIRFAGRRISHTSAHARARRGLVRTFQIPKIFERMTVLENMMVAAPHADEPLWRSLFRGGSRRGERRYEERARSLLDDFGLGHMADEYGGILSGGQRKLLEMARALMPGPRMLLLDEPMAGVNPKLTGQLLEQIERLRKEGMTFLFVEHDLQTVMERSDRVIVMAEGCVIADGTPAAVSKDQSVIDAYLGTVDEGAADG